MLSRRYFLETSKSHMMCFSWADAAACNVWRVSEGCSIQHASTGFNFPRRRGKSSVLPWPWCTGHWTASWICLRRSFPKCPLPIFSKGTASRSVSRIFNRPFFQKLNFSGLHDSDFSWFWTLFPFQILSIAWDLLNQTDLDLDFCKLYVDLSF